MSSLPHLASRGALSSEGGGWSESVIEDLGETLGTGGIEEGFERHHIALVVGQRDTPVRDFIITLCDLIAGGKDGLENDEKGIIDECIRHIYDKYFENPVPENMPLLEDLYDALLAHKNPKAERIANSLVLYVHGSQNYFNHHTNVDSGNRIMCFDIRDLGN